MFALNYSRRSLILLFKKKKKKFLHDVGFVLGSRSCSAEDVSVGLYLQAVSGHERAV